jgi:hypothetical protein
VVGSKKWFVYVTDQGDRFGILADESNVESINGTAANNPPANNTPIYQVPKGIQIRTVTYQSDDGLRTITIPALTQQVYNAIPANNRTIDNIGATGDPNENEGQGDLTFVRKNCEKQRLPGFGSDTGIRDGDN